MKLTEEMKNKIDTMHIANMLSLQRFARIGDLMFQGETGEYFSNIFMEKKSKLTDEEWSKISRQVGW